MIFGREDKREELILLAEKIKACLDYVRSHELLDMEPGVYPIEEGFFVNLCEYETVSVENGNFKKQGNTLDIHYMVAGAEQIDLCLPVKRKLGQEVADKPNSPSTEENKRSVILTTGDYLVCYPDNQFCSAIQVEKPGKIRKVIFTVIL